MTYRSIAQLADSLVLSENDPDFLQLVEQGDDFIKLQTADHFREELVDRIFNGPKIIGTPCRIQKLEDKLRFPPGQVTLWYGVNGHGKSLITSQIALDLAFAEEAVLMFSFEMAPLATLHRMVKQSAGSDNPSRRWVEAFLNWAHARIWVFNHRGQASTKNILAMARYAAARCEVKHVFIDSLMKCVKGEEDYDGQKAFVDECCKLALAAGVHVHLIHHVRKGQDENSYPSKFDIKGSGSISDQVDCAVGVWRNKRKEQKRQNGAPVEDTEPDAVLLIEKNRHIEWEGKVGLYYVPGAQAYTEVRGRPMQYPLNDWMEAVQL